MSAATVTFVEFHPRRTNPKGGKDIPAKAKSADGREFSLGYNADLAALIQGHLNAALEIEYTEKKNGNFTNYYVDRALPVRQAAVATAPRTTAPAPPASSGELEAVRSALKYLFDFAYANDSLDKQLKESIKATSRNGGEAVTPMDYEEIPWED